MALGAIEAIKSAGLNVNKFAIAGTDGVTDARKQYANSLPWNDGQSKHYAIPWTVVTTTNADQLLQGRK